MGAKIRGFKNTTFINIESQAHLDKGVRPTAHGQSQLDKLDKTQAEGYLEQELHKLEQIVLISADFRLEPMEIMLVFLVNVLITESHLFHKICRAKINGPCPNLEGGFQ